MYCIWGTDSLLERYWIEKLIIRGCKIAKQGALFNIYGAFQYDDDIPNKSRFCAHVPNMLWTSSVIPIYLTGYCDFLPPDTKRKPWDIC